MREHPQTGNTTPEQASELLFKLAKGQREPRMRLKGAEGQLDTIVCPKCGMWYYADHAFIHTIKMCPWCGNKSLRVRS